MTWSWLTAGAERRVSLFVKSLLKRRLSREELFQCVQMLVHDLAWMDRQNIGHYRQYLAKNRNADGTSFEDSWRKDIVACIDEVAAEPTWKMQRRKLLASCVHFNRWVAHWNVASQERFKGRVDLWEDMVDNAEAFTSNPRDRWEDILLNMFVMCTLNYGIFVTMGMAGFRIDKDYFNRFTVFLKLREYSIEKRFSFNSDLLDLMDGDPELGRRLFAEFKDKAYPYWLDEDQMFRDLGSDLAAMNPIEKYGGIWRKRSDAYNEVLTSITKRL